MKSLGTWTYPNLKRSIRSGALHRRVGSRKTTQASHTLQDNKFGKMKVATLTKTSSLSLPVDSYIYKILQVDSNLAAISSDDSLRIIDSTSLKEIAGGILKNVHTGVTCLEASENDTKGFLTAGRDAVVRSWDLRSGRSTLELSDGKETKDSSKFAHL